MGLGSTTSPLPRQRLLCLRRVLERLQNLAQGAFASEEASLFSGTASRFYRLDL
jgi:hypothetical protein